MNDSLLGTVLAIIVLSAWFNPEKIGRWAASFDHGRGEIRLNEGD